MSQRLKNIESGFLAKSPLHQARKKSGLQPTSLRDYLFMSGRYEKYITPIYSFMEANRGIFTHYNLQSQSRNQQRQQGARMTIQLMRHLKIDMQKEPEKIIYAFWAISMFDSAIATKTFLHYILYLKSILLFRNQPQHEVFLKRASSLEDLGCFCLTEFNHGSYSKEIQTLAVYQPETSQFVLSTQGTKGMKCWIGGLSQTATSTIMWAQIVVGKQLKGPQPFIVPVRCPKTHKVLPGITIGDCGPKNSLNSIDNGYVILQGVRIPRTNLLGKLGSVDQKGQYKTIIPDSDMRFGFHMNPLSGGRGSIAFAINVIPLKALTAGLRYSFSRKQFDNKQGTDQVRIIDYPLTKSRIIPQLAQTIVTIRPGLQIARKYTLDPSIFTNFQLVAELHAISASLKARSTWSSTAATGAVRTVLGGHGYSSLSKMAAFYHDSDVNTTWEGDNNLLLQQTSKFLMKAINKKKECTLLPINFIWESLPKEQWADPQLNSLEYIEQLMKDLLRRKAANAHQCLKQTKDPLNFHGQAGNQLALSYADYFIYRTNILLIPSISHPQTKQFLGSCLRLWACKLLEQQRYGDYELRIALRGEVLKLSDELVDPMVKATDALIPSTHITGTVFTDQNGDGFKDYLNLLYTGKGTFARTPYYKEILSVRQGK